MTATTTPHTGGLHPSWAEPLDTFAAWLLDTGRAPATADGYVRHLTWLAADATEGPWELTTPTLLAWLDAHRWSAQTRRKVVVSLRTFYAWAVAEGLCAWAPTAGLPTAAHKRPGPIRKPIAPAWADALAAYLTHLRAGSRTVGTLEQRRWWLTRLAESSADPWTITGEQLALWLSNPDWQPETKRAGRSTVQSFYRWAVLAGHLAQSPAEHLPTITVPRALPRPTPHDAVAAALAAADARQRVALKLAAYAGLRRAEIAAVHFRDLDASTLLVTGKGGHMRRVPLHPDLAAELHTEQHRRRNGNPGAGFGDDARPDGYLFPSAAHPSGHLTPAHVGKLIRACLPDGWTTHTLRHRFATLAYSTERDLRAVQELLGHRKPETTARYAATPPDALTRAVAGVAL